MKKSILIVIGLLFSVYSFSQGNLQFNQALMFNTTNSATTLLGTVPSGKVWKIEGYGTEVEGGSSCGFSFNGTNVAFRAGSAYNYNTGYTPINNYSDFWLPAGSTIYALSGCGASYRWISIIEFNIIP